MKEKYELEISNLLKTLGVSPHLLGYRYLRYAIQLQLLDDTYADSMTKRLYPSIAKKFNTAVTRAERAIRHAIEEGWLKANMDVIEDVFGNIVDYNRGKPTNTQYITTVADYLYTRLHE